MPNGLTSIPRGAILDLIGGLGGFSCYWDGDGLDYDTTYISLSVAAYRTIGQDEIRRDFDPAKDQILTTLCGNRALTLGIRVDSYDLSTPAYDILENIRRRLRGGAARQVYEQEGLALIRIHPIVDLGAVADNRAVFRSTMDVELAFAVNEVDITSASGGDYIKSAPTTGTVTNVDGTLLPPVTTT